MTPRAMILGALALAAPLAFGACTDPYHPPYAYRAPAYGLMPPGTVVPPPPGG